MTQNRLLLIFNWGVMIVFLITFTLFVIQVASIIPKYHKNHITSDYIQWKQSNTSIIVESINPIIKNKFKGNVDLLLTNDLLTSVEFNQVQSVDSLQEILRRTEEKKLLNYNVERTDTALALPLDLNYLLEMNRVPFFLFMDNMKLWNLNIYLSGAAVCFGIIICFILFPFFGKIKIISTAFLIMIFATLSWLIAAFLRQIGIVLGYTFSIGWTDSILLCVWMFGFVIAVVGLAYSNHKPKGIYRIFLISMVSCPVFMFFYFFGILRSYADYHFILNNYLYQTMLLIGIFYLVQELAERKFAKALVFGIGSIMVIIIGSFALLGIVFNEYLQLAAQCVLVLPITMNAYKVVTLGKVRVILTQSLSFSLFIIFLFFAYFGIHAFLQDYVTNVKYIGAVELLILLFIGGILYLLYNANKGKLGHYFISESARKSEDYAKLQQEMFTVSNSKKLIELFETKGTEMFSPGKLKVIKQFEMDSNQRIVCENNLNLNWSKNKLFNPLRLSNTNEDYLSTQRVDILFVFLMRDQSMLWIEYKSQQGGVINLETYEKISGLITQLKLTLDILVLLEKEKEMATQKMEANLKALRAQINPHFLFNTLNTISALIRHQADLAEQVVDKLAAIFRHTLKYFDDNFVLLRDEIKLSRDYLAIEKVRFGEKLTVEWEVSDDSLECLIPSFALQTVIENSIKHGLTPKVENGMVRIRTSLIGKNLIVEVYDDGVGFQNKISDSGYGLENIRNRFRDHFQDENLVSIQSEPGKTSVKLTVPQKSTPNPGITQ